MGRGWRPILIGGAVAVGTFALAQAQASMNVIGARIAKDFPASNKGWGVIVESYASTIVGQRKIRIVPGSSSTFTGPCPGIGRRCSR